MLRSIWLVAATLLAGCASAPDGQVSPSSQDVVQAAPSEITSDLVIVSDAVSWPSKLWFCPVSSDGMFESECARNVRLPRAPGQTNSVVEGFFDMGTKSVGRASRTFRRKTGEVYFTHPSVSPASGRYALVQAFDPRGSVGGRIVNIRTATYVFEPKPQLVAILPGTALSGTSSDAFREKEIATVRRLLPNPDYDYRVMKKVRIECDRTGIIYGGDGKERCQIMP